MQHDGICRNREQESVSTGCSALAPARAPASTTERSRSRRRQLDGPRSGGLARASAVGRAAKRWCQPGRRAALTHLSNQAIRQAIRQVYAGHTKRGRSVVIAISRKRNPCGASMQRHAGLRMRRPCQIEFRNARPPTAPTLPLIGGTTAGPAGSSRIKLHRLQVRLEEGPRPVLAQGCPDPTGPKWVRLLRSTGHEYARRPGGRRGRV